MAAENKKMVIKHESWITCDVCGKKSRTSNKGINVAREEAEQDGWLVGWPAKRRQGKPDYCPEHRPAVEDACSFNDTERGRKCPLEAQYIFTSHGVRVSSCGRHHAQILRGLFNSDPDQEITVIRLREGFKRNPQG